MRTACEASVHSTPSDGHRASGCGAGGSGCGAGGGVVRAKSHWPIYRKSHAVVEQRASQSVVHQPLPLFPAQSQRTSADQPPEENRRAATRERSRLEQPAHEGRRFEASEGVSAAQ